MTATYAKRRALQVAALERAGVPAEKIIAIPKRGREKEAWALAMKCLRPNTFVAVCDLADITGAQLDQIGQSGATYISVIQ